MGDRPPAVVMPALLNSLTGAGHVGIGVLRRVLFEVTGRRDEHEEVVAEVFQNLQVLARYVDHQMAGRLRMDPLLAIQSFVAPIVLHIPDRPLIEHHGLVDTPFEKTVREFTHAWLHAMAPPRQLRRQPAGGADPGTAPPKRNWRRLPDRGQERGEGPDLYEPIWFRSERRTTPTASSTTSRTTLTSVTAS